MQVVHSAEVLPVAATDPLFVGGVTRQQLVGGELSKDFVVQLVNFEQGARNRFHRHTTDQVLMVTYGTGIVATDATEAVVHPGDVIVIPAGEKHWHGATPTSAFSHISVTGTGYTTEIVE